MAAGLEAAWQWLQQAGGQISLTDDSRVLRAGEYFLAYPGVAGDGRRHIAAALQAGAAGVLWEAAGFEWQSEWAVPNLPVSGLKQWVGALSSLSLGEPTQHMWMIGVTGTNGKTSCTQWIAEVLSGAGKKTAVVGTLGNGFPGQMMPATHTTPLAVALQKMLAGMRQEGAEAIAMEVSSHGLEQGRVNGVAFDVAVLTNLSRDHLDYHGDMASYAAAKARLFDWAGLRHAVLNLDDPFGGQMQAHLQGKPVEVLGYGFERGELRASNLRATAAGVRFDVATPWGNTEMVSPLLGRFNVSNLLASLGTLLVSGVQLEAAVAGLQKVAPPAGRMQRLGGNGKPTVVVDYAHTPDALEKVLHTLRELLPAGAGELHCVFGCGGDRDKGKRPLMGKVAGELADQVMLTSDNPRSEDPLAILADIESGMCCAYAVQPDRALAIAEAIRRAQASDIVLIAGKGHEDYQEINGIRLPFSDVDAASRALQDWV